MNASAALTVVFALVLDALFGEPRNALHPVAWFGSIADWFARRAPTAPPLRAWLSGLGITAVSAALAWISGSSLERVAAIITNDVPRAVVLALCLKPTFAIRALGEAGERMHAALERSDLYAAQAALGWLCSRKADGMNERELSASTIESLAENTSDSIVAPLFYYALLGLPGAITFRVVNTLDAMIGYRDQREWLGKVAARCDDVLGFIPARLTGALIALASPAPLRGVRVMLRDAKQTASPNAGWPMAAMAGGLGVQLPKAGAYSLGDDGRPAMRADIRSAWRVCRRAAWIASAIAAGTALRAA